MNQDQPNSAQGGQDANKLTSPTADVNTSPQNYIAEQDAYERDYRAGIPHHALYLKHAPNMRSAEAYIWSGTEGLIGTAHYTLPDAVSPHPSEVKPPPLAASVFGEAA